MSGRRYSPLTLSLSKGHINDCVFLTQDTSTALKTRPDVSTAPLRIDKGSCDAELCPDLFGSGDDVRVEIFNVYEKGKLETMVLEYYWGDGIGWSREKESKKISIRLIVAGVKYI